MGDTPLSILHCPRTNSFWTRLRSQPIGEPGGEQKIPAVALDDHGTLFRRGAFLTSGAGEGVQPVSGCEVYVSQQGRTAGRTKDRYNHLVLLCERRKATAT